MALDRFAQTPRLVRGRAEWRERELLGGPVGHLVVEGKRCWHYRSFEPRTLAAVLSRHAKYNWNTFICSVRLLIVKLVSVLFSFICISAALYESFCVFGYWTHILRSSQGGCVERFLYGASVFALKRVW